MTKAYTGTTLEDGYACFISYRHSDNVDEAGSWASWLHTELETYRVPDALVGKPNRAGTPIPERIYPVFRDELSAALAADLKDELHEALDRSENLVVICTPGAARSPYINEEVRYFKAKKGADHIFGLVVAGDPVAPEGDSQDCQPTALRYQLGEDGAITDQPDDEPLFADVRTSTGDYGHPVPKAYIRKLREDGRTKAYARAEAERYAERLKMMKLKVVAGLLDIPLDDLLQREQLYQEKQRRSAEREALWTFGAFLATPFLIAATLLYNWVIKEDRFQGIDRDAPLSQVGELIYLQLSSDNLAMMAFVLGGLIMIGTIRLRRSLTAAHLAGIALLMAIIGVGTYTVIDRQVMETEAIAKRLDVAAAAGEFDVDPYAPNLRRLFDGYRNPIPKCPGGEGTCDLNAIRAEIDNPWRRYIGPFMFVPVGVLLILPVLGLMVLRLFRSR